MIYSPGLKSSAARHIARTAQQKIRTKTGMNVAMLLCPVEAEVWRTPTQMMQVIAMSMGMNAELYKAHTRKREVAELRFIAAMFIRVHFPDVTLVQIAEYFGGQDHTSILKGMARANDLILTGDERFIQKYNTALAAVNNWLCRLLAIAA